MIPFGPYLCFAFMAVFLFVIDPLLSLLDAYQQWLVGRMY